MLYNNFKSLMPFSHHTHSFIFLLGNRHEVLVELPRELDVVPLDDVAPADLLHDLLPVD